MKAFRLFLCMVTVAGTLMAAPVQSRVPATSWVTPSNELLHLLEAIFGKLPSKSSTVLKSNEIELEPSTCGVCTCDPGQKCSHGADGSCSCG